MSQTVAHQAIVTKFYGPTNTTGSRVRAKCSAKWITLPWDYALDTFPNHQRAASELVKALGWPGTLIGGALPDGTFCFVLTDGGTDAAVLPAPSYAIDFTPEEIQAATAWHGGQGSKLYAISSVGQLRLGNRRPTWRGGDRDGQPMTDAEWFREIATDLEGEAESAAAQSREDDLGAGAEILEGIAAKCRAAIAALGPQS